MAIETSKNTHMTHIEDLVIYGGVAGARQAIVALRSLRDMLAGNATSGTDVTVKWDGAPAVFFGHDPADGKFFVAKKGIFNKNPKVYKSYADIDADTSGDLNQKLKDSFDELSKLGVPKGKVIQGDLMFSKGDLRNETIDGTKYLVFQPNTIAYAVPIDSSLGREIKAANIGIVLHTEYTGDSFENMKASFGVDVSKFKKVKSVWAQDAQLRNLSGNVTMTAKETAEVTKALSDAGKIFRKIASSTLREIEQNQVLAQTIETYNNTFVRKGQKITNTTKHVDGLIKYIEDKFQKDIDKLKSEKGKAGKREKLAKFLEFFSDSNKANLKLIFDLQAAIVVAKENIINKLSKLNKIDTFVLTNNGYRVTGHEGFVAIDRVKGGAYKLVDRLEFSTNNFSLEIIKGWQSVTRK